MGSKYPAVKAGEWIRPVVGGYKMKCCDCGLVHRFDFRIVNGEIELRAFRDNRATAQSRRHAERKERRFIRFGDIPTNGRSSVFCGDAGKIGAEIGVSVYDAAEIDGEWRVVMPAAIDYSTCVSLSGVIDRPASLVEGRVVGVGRDSEPLLADIKIVRDLGIICPRP
jgi:hypothetical protein